MSSDHEAWFAEVRERVDAELDRRLRFDAMNEEAPGARALRDAIRYAGLGPGKRLRPALVIAACEATGGTLEDGLPGAAAVEMLHAYTLVHDDLPAMDDDDMRRGRKTVHVEFDEATAILAGDALLTEAFIALADLGDRTADAVRVLGKRGGTEELLAGQANDLHAERNDLKPGWEQLEHIHRGKTGALFAAAAELGGICARCSAEQRAELAELGMTIGIAFQHGDDRLDDEHQSHRERARQRVAELAARAEQRVQS
ncbi:MAG: polyprenyl synthetase family protein, partial [Deltaproteobacteria bacterium]|nr:polyprenyl synthetase family protein [Deltaproteobacteria bacterium]